MDFFKNIFKHTERSFFSNDYQDFSNEEHPNPRFDVFSDPTVMHQYFENQINEILKSFQLDESSTIFSTPPDFCPEDNTEQHKHSLRDHFLKDGYEKLNKNEKVKTDLDLDERVKNGNLESLLKDNIIHNVEPHEHQTQGNFFSSQSQSFQVTTLPDGTIQTENFVEDNKGNEEKTICHKIGNKEYCVIQRKNKYGKEEVHETFSNISEDEKDDFIRTYRNLTTNGTSSKFPFNFFK